METQAYYRPVNWADGMKLNKDHFNAQQHAQTQQLVWSTGAHITAVNYGLLPAVAAGRRSLLMQVAADTQQLVQVRLQYCYAVTPGGCLVHIDESASLAAPLTASVALDTLNGAGGNYLVVLTVNPYERQPVGEAAEDETPPRLPFTMPSYIISLVDETSLGAQKPGAYHLTLGRVIINGAALQVDETYIPPCANVLSFPPLIAVYEELETALINIESYSLQILQKINQKAQQNRLAYIVKQICLAFVQYCSTHAMEFRWAAPHQPPVVMLSQLASVARLMKNVLDQYVGAGREELMTYLSDWCKLKQGELDAVMTDITTAQYSHEAIRSAVDKTTAFTSVLVSLLYELSRLDYIGRKEEVEFFVKEEEVISGKQAGTPETGKRPSFLQED
jgi:hypothetical protein